MLSDKEKQEGAWIRVLFFPITWAEAERDRISPTPDEPTIENMVRFLTDPKHEPTLKHFLEGYEIISEYERWMPLDYAPDEKRFLNKLVWPLRHAKSSFMLGNYLGTIALCGMVAEMIAILRWEMDEGQPNASKWPSTTDFEGYAQKRRVDLMKQRKLIAGMEEQWFTMVREARRKYLHFLTYDDEGAVKDALISYRHVCSLVSWIIGQRHYQTRPEVNPILIEYLRKKGLLLKGAPTEPVLRRLPNEEPPKPTGTNE